MKWQNGVTHFLSGKEIEHALHTPDEAVTGRREHTSTVNRNLEWDCGNAIAFMIYSFRILTHFSFLFENIRLHRYSLTFL